MDQSVEPATGDRLHSIQRLSSSIAAAVDAAQAHETPFFHLTLEHVFPDEFYAAMLAAMPVADDYRPMSGRAKRNDLADGTHTRVKLDLFPEFIRVLPPHKAAVWDLVGAALRSEPVKQAFMRRLAPGLQARFGKDFMSVSMYSLPILTRDVTGYRLLPHPDTLWKGITVQFYLPRDSSIAHIGTIFNERVSAVAFSKSKQMKFLPNSGYAFAVDTHTWHSAELIGPEVASRDSILLTYMVDNDLLRKVRNRGKRVGSYLREGLRRIVGR